MPACAAAARGRYHNRHVSGGHSCAYCVSCRRDAGFDPARRCGSPRPSETVILSQQQSACDTPLDGRWRKAHQTRRIAILVGRAETTLFLHHAVLRSKQAAMRQATRACGLRVGLRTGPIEVAYRFDAKTEQKGVVRVRGQRRNDPCVRLSCHRHRLPSRPPHPDTLKVRASRPAFLIARRPHFRWDREDKCPQIDVLVSRSSRAHAWTPAVPETAILRNRMTTTNTSTMRSRLSCPIAAVYAWSGSARRTHRLDTDG